MAKMIPTKELFEKILEGDQLNVVVKEKGEFFVRWDSIRIEQNDSGILCTLLLDGIGLMTCHIQAKINFATGDKFTLGALRGLAPIVLRSCEDEIGT